MTEITRKTRLCSSAGGTLNIVSNETGELLAEIAVPAGAVPAGQYLALVPEGAVLEIGDGLAALNPPHRIGVQPHPLAREVGANPDFQPTSADRFQREMRMTLARIQAKSERVESRLKKLAEIERIPEAPKADPAPVIEPTPEPTAEPTPEPSPNPEGKNVE